MHVYVEQSVLLLFQSGEAGSESRASNAEEELAAETQPSSSEQDRGKDDIELLLQEKEEVIKDFKVCTESSLTIISYLVAMSLTKHC